MIESGPCVKCPAQYGLQIVCLALVAVAVLSHDYKCVWCYDLLC